MRNGRVARDLTVLQGARRENILYGSSTDEQRSSSVKDRQPSGLFSGGRLAALLLSHRARLAMLLRRALPDARQKTARSFHIYEKGFGLRWVLVAVFLKSLTAGAQMLDSGVNSAMIKLFG